MPALGKGTLGNLCWNQFHTPAPLSCSTEAGRSQTQLRPVLEVKPSHAPGGFWAAAPGGFGQQPQGFLGSSPRALGSSWRPELPGAGWMLCQSSVPAAGAQMQLRAGRVSEQSQLLCLSGAGERLGVTEQPCCSGHSEAGLARSQSPVWEAQLLRGWDPRHSCSASPWKGLGCPALPCQGPQLPQPRSVLRDPTCPSPRDISGWPWLSPPGWLWCPGWEEEDEHPRAGGECVQQPRAGAYWVALQCYK